MKKNYSQEEIDNLIQCEKTITDPPKRVMILESGHYRNNMKLVSSDQSHEFEVFIRVNKDFSENFSIGLIYVPHDGSGSLPLIRCNGCHGEHYNGGQEHFIAYHVHLAKEDNLAEGLNPLKYAEIINDYATYQDALAYFIKRCNILNYQKHFSFLNNPENLKLF